MSWRRLGQLASRPIRERERAAAFWICAAILAAAAALLFSLPDTGPAPEPLPHGLEYGSAPPPESPPPPRPGRGPELAARQFIPDYLAFISGRGSARLRAATATLAAQLAGSRLRVSPAARESRPKLVALETHATLDAELVHVAARISDGPVTYSLAVDVERRGGRWLVIGIGGD